MQLELDNGNNDTSPLRKTEHVYEHIPTALDGLELSEIVIAEVGA